MATVSLLIAHRDAGGAMEPVPAPRRRRHAGSRLAPRRCCHRRRDGPNAAGGRKGRGLGVAQVRLEKVSKRFGAEPAVDSVSFTADPGTLVVLLGPSGCGKSTTLRLIAGLEAADEGVIEIAGRDVTTAPPARRGTAMVFQSYALFPHLSVAENIVFGLKVRRVPRAERAARLKRAAEEIGRAHV